MTRLRNPERPLPPSIVDYLQGQPRERAEARLFETLVAAHVGTENEALLIEQMQTAGNAFATGNPLPTCADLTDVETAVNERLAHQDWGFVEIMPTEQAVQIRLFASPSMARPTEWAPLVSAFFTGLLARWLLQMDGADGLELVATESDDPSAAAFLLAAAPRTRAATK